MANETALATTSVSPAIMETVLLQGDLQALSPEDRIAYYQRVCESLGLNPLTQPFAYIKLSGKLVLYAKRDAADQLRNLHGISVDKPEITFENDQVIVLITGHNKEGRTDADMGVVSLTGLKGDARANAILKAVTKAKRRLTLSIVGLGWLDETEVETIPGVAHVEVDKNTGEIAPPRAAEPRAQAQRATPSSTSYPQGPMCAEHGIRFFRTPKMRSYAHPRGEGEPWCNMPADSQIDPPTPSPLDSDALDDRFQRFWRWVAEQGSDPVGVQNALGTGLTAWLKANGGETEEGFAAALAACEEAW